MDIQVENGGSVFLLRATSELGESWVDENIGQDNGYQPYWPTVVVESRYIEDIVYGMQADGLEVE